MKTQKVWLVTYDRNGRRYQDKIFEGNGAQDEDRACEVLRAFALDLGWKVSNVRAKLYGYAKKGV